MSPDARRRSRPSLGSAVELRLREIRRCQPQDLVRPPQFDVLAFELFEPRAFVRGQPGPPAAITLGLPHPAPQRLGRAPDLRGDRGDRRPLRRVLRGVLEHHPHRALPHLRGKPTRSRHDPILSRNGASEKPGAVQEWRILPVGEVNDQPTACEGGHQRNAQWQKISARGPRDQLWMAAGKTSRPSTLPKFSVTASAERRKADRPETGGSTVLPEAGTRKGGRRWPPSDGTAVTSE